ncbi:MAG TPA: TonB-dependent receptor, partial [Rhodothermales bacterium]|nr:TonB-dependent receptor [Rhodothermales bacterium]
NDPEDFDVYWINFFDIQGAIQDIQVQRGAGASFYGPDAIGGAINIVAVPYKPDPYARVEAGYGTYDTRRYTAEANSGLLKDHYVVYGRYSRLLSDGYRDWSWTSFNRFFAGVARYGKHSTLTVQAFGGPQHDGLAYVGIPRSANEDPEARRANYSSATHDVEHFHQPHAEVLHDWTINPNWSLKQALFWMQGKGYFDFGGTYRSANYLRLPAGWRGLTDLQRTQPLYVTAPDVNLLFRAYVGQWQIGWIPRVTYRRGASETTIGTEMRLHRSVRWGRIQDATGIPSELVGTENDARVYQFHGEKIIGSVFASELFRPTDRLAVQGDLQLTYRRYRQYDEAFFGTAFAVPYVFLNPRLGVTINPEHPVSGYASVAIAGREPVLKSLYDGEEAGAGFEPQFEKDDSGRFDFDDPFVTPEHLVDVEVGASLSRPAYRLSGNVFWMDFHDEIVPSGGLDQFGVPRTGNADRTRHVGLELEGFVRPLPGLDARANLTLSRNRFIHFTEYVTGLDGNTVPAVRDGNPIAGFPEQVASVLLSYTRAGATLSLDGKYAGRQYVDNSGGTGLDGESHRNLSVDPYVLLNASVRYAFPQQSAFHGIELAFDVNNVLNQKVLLYGDVGAAGPQFFPTATRHIFASIRYTLR